MPSPGAVAIAARPAPAASTSITGMLPWAKRAPRSALPAVLTDGGEPIPAEAPVSRKVVEPTTGIGLTSTADWGSLAPAAAR